MSIMPIEAFQAALDRCEVDITIPSPFTVLSGMEPPRTDLTPIQKFYLIRRCCEEIHDFIVGASDYPVYFGNYLRFMLRSLGNDHAMMILAARMLMQQFRHFKVDPPSGDWLEKLTEWVGIDAKYRELILA